MTTTLPTTQPKQDVVHLSPALKDRIANSPYTETPIDRQRLERLFISIHRNKRSTISHSAETDGRNDESVQGLWLIILTGALFALNALDAISHLYRYAVAQTVGDEEKTAFVAERMREVGLKTVSFMGVPRVRPTKKF
jgi:hypothetical protein